MELLTTLTDILSERILVLDGGLGSMMPAFGLEEADYRGTRLAESPVNLKGCYEALLLTRPEVIASVHADYLRAGADIITTNTLNANALSLEDYALADHVYEINLTAARIARALADGHTSDNPEKPRFVAGSVGSTNRTASLSPDLYDPGARAVTFGELAAVYREQIRGLLDGGAHIILIETAIDTLNIKAALWALDDLCAERAQTVPVMVSGTLTDASGRLLSGQTVEAFYASVRRSNTLSVGLNCSFGAIQMLPYIERIARLADCAVSVYPNAGLPDDSGGYNETPKHMALVIEKYLHQGLLNIVGGCCGTTPEHIRLIVAAAERNSPRPIPAQTPTTLLSGLEELPLTGGEFTLVGDRATANNPAFVESIRQGSFESALYGSVGQLSEGAQMMALCLDAEGIEAQSALPRLLNLAMSDPNVARVPLLVNSRHAEALGAALGCVQGRSLAASVSLEEGDDALLTAVRGILSYGAVAVIRLADEEGEANTFVRKSTIARRAYRLLKKAGILPRDIVFDLSLPSLKVGGIAVAQSVQLCIYIQENCPGARSLGDVGEMSQMLATREPIRRAFHAVYLHHAVQAGLDLGILDPAQLTVHDQIDPELRSLCEKIVEGSAPEATAQLLMYNGPTEIPLAEEPAERLAQSLLRGSSDNPDALVEAACGALGSAGAVVEGPVAEGVRRLNRAVIRHELFLPGLIRGATLLQKISGLLDPALPPPSEQTPRVMLPNWTGDAGELGKTAAILALRAREVAFEALGGRPLPERIVNETIRTGSSALMLWCSTRSSRPELLRIAATARRLELTVPLLVGGPGLSHSWIEKNLTPLHSGPVRHLSDPAQCTEIRLPR